MSDLLPDKIGRCGGTTVHEIGGIMNEKENPGVELRGIETGIDCLKLPSLRDSSIVSFRCPISVGDIAVHLESPSSDVPLRPDRVRNTYRFVHTITMCLNKTKKHRTLSRCACQLAPNRWDRMSLSTPGRDQHGSARRVGS